MQLDPLHASIALGPLAAYLVLLGLVNLSRRPMVTTGARDVAALGLAVAGCVFVGPVELFLPDAAIVELGWVAWLLLAGFYGLLLTLGVLLLRPRLVIYNVTADQLRPALATVVAELDGQARWAGDSLILPKLGVQLHVEPVSATRNAELISSGPNQNYGGWRALELALTTALRRTTNSPNPYAAFPLGCGLLMALLVAFLTLSNPGTVAQSLIEMFRL